MGCAVENPRTDSPGSRGTRRLTTRLPAPRRGAALRPKRPLRGQMSLAESLRPTQVWLRELYRRGRFGSPETLEDMPLDLTRHHSGSRHCRMC